MKKLETRLKVLVKPHLNRAYKADLLALAAQEQINLGDYSGAKVTLKKALKLAETYFVLSKFGWIADYEGDFSRAKEIWIKIKNKTQDVELLETATHFLGRDNWGLGNYDQALKIRQSTQKYPKGLSDAQFGLALCAFSKGDEQKAIELALQAISNQPNLINRKFV